jgi:hypothetical protein
MKFTPINFNKTYFKYVSILVCLSFIVTLKGKINYDSFTDANIPVFDGVMYQYQQIRRFEAFKNDFSFINRFSQSIYEFEGNYVNGAYNAFITFFFPSFLKNDIDVFVRSFSSIFIFSLSIFIYFKKNIPKNKLILIITGILQFPIFYHYRVGLGSYIPELTCSLILISGYLMMLHFFNTFKLRYFLIGMLLMILPIGIRLNFFAYSFLFFIPIAIIFINKWSSFSPQIKKISVLVSILTLITVSVYVNNYLELFIQYYTKTAYSYSNINAAFYEMICFFWEYISWQGLLILITTLLIASCNSVESKNSNWLNNLTICFPYLFFFSFIILYLKSSNIPHVIGAMTTFFIVLFFIRIPIRNTSIVKIINSKLTLGFIILLIISMNFSFKQNQSLNLQEKQYTAQRKVITFLSNEVKKGNTPPSYLCFFEGLTEIPINVSVYFNTNKLLTNSQYFWNHDIFFRNGLKCKNGDECFNYYLQHIKHIKYIIINSNSPLKKVGLYPISRKINIKMAEYLKNNINYKVCKKIQSTYYGEILIYEKK